MGLKLVDVTPRPLAAICMDLFPLAAVCMDQQPLAVMDFTIRIFAQVEVPVFPQTLTQDFLTSNGDILTSDGEALTW